MILNGYLDGRAVIIGGERLDLDGLVVVEVNGDGVLVPVDGQTPSMAEARDQEEAEGRESDAAGDAPECTRCGATVVCDVGVTTEDVSYSK